MVKSVKIPVYAAGGVRNEQDILNLKKIRVHGIIIGKAFYEHKLPFSIVTNTKYIN
jgi:phosphoribosylformimino-5-aminoimidazole carboxamide ribonucleotide (ProFAR) isomerase